MTEEVRMRRALARACGISLEDVDLIRESSENEEAMLATFERLAERNGVSLRLVPGLQAKTGSALELARRTIERFLS